MSKDGDPVVSPTSQSLREFQKDVTYRDCVLIVMGTPGAGRTTFVHQLTMQPMKTRPPEYEVAPDTIKVDYRSIQPTTWTRNNRIIVLDTPAIEGAATLHLYLELLSWIKAALKKRVAFIGFIVLYDILIDNHTYDVGTLRELFGACIERKTPYKVVILTTRWSEINKEKGERKQSRLEEQRWKETIDGGTKVVKLAEVGIIERDIVLDILPEPAPKYGLFRELVYRAEAIIPWRAR